MTLATLVSLHVTTGVRIIETNSFRQDVAPRQQETANNRQQKLVESLAIFNSDNQPQYVDSSEIRSDGSKGPFFPIQFPTPLKYDQSNAIRYNDKPSDVSQFSLGNIDIGDADSSSKKYISALLPRGDTRDYTTPLISKTRDIEIYHQDNSDELSVFSGESIDIEMFDSVYQTDTNTDHHPGQSVIQSCVHCPHVRRQLSNTLHNNLPVTGPINFSTEPGTMSEEKKSQGFVSNKYIDSSFLRKQTNNKLSIATDRFKDRISFGKISFTNAYDA